MNVQQTPPMALKYINREMKERTGKLVLSDCGLREIPKEVFEMDWLEELVITNGYVTEEEKARQQSKVAKKVVKMKGGIREPNFLSEIPKEIGQLQHLKKVRIGGWNQSWDIADTTAISRLHHLVELDLSYNSISDVNGLDKLTGLRSLDLSNNNIIDILPQVVKNVGKTKFEL